MNDSISFLGEKKNWDKSQQDTFAKVVTFWMNTMKNKRNWIKRQNEKKRNNSENVQVDFCECRWQPTNEQAHHWEWKRKRSRKKFVNFACSIQTAFRLLTYLFPLKYSFYFLSFRMREFFFSSDFKKIKDFHV